MKRGCGGLNEQGLSSGLTKLLPQRRPGATARIGGRLGDLEGTAQQPQHRGGIRKVGMSHPHPGPRYYSFPEMEVGIGPELTGKQPERAPRH